MLERLLNIFPGQVGHAAKQNLPRHCTYAWRRRVYCESSEFRPPRAQLLMLIMLLQQLYTASASAAEGRGLAERLCQASLMAARERCCSEKPLLSTPDLPCNVPLLLRLLLLFCYCRCSTCHRRTSTRSPEQWVPAFSTTWLHRIGRLALGNPGESCSHDTAKQEFSLANIVVKLL